MSDKEPIIYRAYGTVRGTYKPNKSDPTTGTLTTDDKEKFKANLIGEVADLFTKETEALTQQVLWKCYFKTKPVTLELKDVRTKNVDKNRYQSFKVNKFQVQGKVLKATKAMVTVEIQPTKEDIEPFTLQLKGKFTEDISHPYWRFYLERKKRSFEIVSVKKIGIDEEAEETENLIEEAPVIEKAQVIEKITPQKEEKKSSNKSKKETGNKGKEVIKVESKNKPQIRTLIKKKPQN